MPDIKETAEQGQGNMPENYVGINVGITDSLLHRLVDRPASELPLPLGRAAYHFAASVRQNADFERWTGDLSSLCQLPMGGSLTVSEDGLLVRGEFMGTLTMMLQAYRLVNDYANRGNLRLYQNTLLLVPQGEA